MNATAVSMRLRSYPAWVKVALVVYVLAFAFGTCVHVTILMGLWGPAPHPLAHHPLIHAYADSLTLLDPLVIFLLFRFPRAGLLLASAIILSDVGMHAFETYMYVAAAGPYAVGIDGQLQTAFLGFVLGTAPFLWSYVGRKDPAK
jgi:hypothetical protein